MFRVRARVGLLKSKMLHNCTTLEKPKHHSYATSLNMASARINTGYTLVNRRNASVHLTCCTYTVLIPPNGSHPWARYSLHCAEVIVGYIHIRWGGSIVQVALYKRISVFVAQFVINVEYICTHTRTCYTQEHVNPNYHTCVTLSENDNCNLYSNN